MVIDWIGKASLRKWHLSWDLTTKKGPVLWAEGTVNAKALRQKWTWCIWGTARWSIGLTLKQRRVLRDKVRADQEPAHVELTLGHGKEAGFYSKCSGRPFGYYSAGEQWDLICLLKRLLLILPSPCPNTSVQVLKCTHPVSLRSVTIFQLSVMCDSLPTPVQSVTKLPLVFLKLNPSLHFHCHHPNSSP